MIFAPKINYPFGLDISDLSLKLVQLQKAGNKISIQALNKVSFSEGVIVDGQIQNEAEFLKQLQLLINKPKYGKVTTEEVVACLPEKRTFIKLIKLERNPNNLHDMIENEIVNNVPFSLDEIYYDWQLVGQKGSEQLVLLGAAPKNIVNQYTEILDKLKLSINALEIEPISICRSLLAEESPHFKNDHIKNYVIIDIGHSRTSMIFYAASTILFTVSMPISGLDITNTIADQLQIERDQAEKAKIICGLDKDKAEGVIYKIMSKNINDLKQKIIQAFDYYQDNFSEFGKINKIYLSGGGANIKGLDDIIKNSTNIEVSKANAMANLGNMDDKFIKLLSETHSLNLDKNKKSNSSLTQDVSLSYSTAIGLALRSAFIKNM
jgi:type IV pilus assembly protein PilM